MIGETAGRFTAERFAAPAAVDRLRSRALLAGGAGILLAAVGFLLDRPAFFRAWLVGWLYWLGIALGCLAIMMLHHMTRGAWGLVARRLLEAAARTVPLLALLFLPLLFGLRELYSWARPEAAADHLLQLKAAYLNVPFFVARAALYCLIWGGFAFLLSGLSRRQDETGDLRLTRRMQLVAAPGIVLYCLAASFASVDWLMSLQPHWFSTIYGVYFLGGQGLSALAFLIVVAFFFARREPLGDVLSSGHFHDWGKLLLAFVMLWTYFSFSQFLIVWAGNLPEEVTWYLARTRHGWQWVALALVLFHFALPFVLLLSRDLKRRPRRLALVAGWMLVMRWVDLVWQVQPAFGGGRFAFSWLYLVTPVAVGGLWLAAWAGELKKRPLLPIRDPWLPEAVAHD
ncbi:MAG TPA: hypothetical protein VF121_06200 [Thermoanaerobaculia bacterium]|nr:hypothetical protein [Thermoanaerobaculia bacterium]